jgi:heptaprenyl diphosphate synthase
MKKLSATRRLTLITMLLAMSILMHMVEPTIPLPIPGVKLGLANIMGLIALILFGEKTMLSINFMRVILASLLRGILFGTGFWLSMGGVLISSIVTILFYRQQKLSIIGLSVASSAFHGLGQILVLMFINQTVLMVYWLPVLWFSSVPTGYLTGSLSRSILSRIRS